jgi:hypothetical protein
MTTEDHTRAPAGGVSEYGRVFRGGEFLPFYVPRPDMPQVDEANLPELVARAFNAGISPTFDVTDPRRLRAHQRVDHARAAGMPLAVKLKPILVSSDGYVLDGNHRWWAHVHEDDGYISVIRLGLPFEQAIAWLFELPFTYKLTAITPERN